MNTEIHHRNDEIYYWNSYCEKREEREKKKKRNKTEYIGYNFPYAF